MAMRSLLGVDLATSSTKGAAFDRSGRCLATTQASYRYETPRDGLAEADAEEW